MSGEGALVGAGGGLALGHGAGDRSDPRADRCVRHRDSFTAKTTVIAKVTLKNGKGTYTLTASQLKAGSCTLVATYGGNTDYAASTSAKKNLTVAK